MLKILKKIGVLSLLILMLGVLVACGSKEKETAVKEEKIKEITVGVTTFGDVLEPTYSYNAWAITRYGVGENLVRFDENGKLQGQLAKSWEISDDLLTWTFEIKEGIKFSNGNPLTAEAVKTSLERVFEKTKRAESFFKYESIEANGQILKIKTDKPVAVLAATLAEPLFLIVDTSVNTEEFASKGPISTGPYVFQEFKPSEYTVVVKNENYWGGSPKLDKVTFKDINDQNTRALALKSGEIDIAYNLKQYNKADFEGMDNIVIQNLKSLRSSFAFINEKGDLKDKVLRQAILRALDRETYTQVLLQGAATAGKAPIPPTLDYGFDELIDENGYNPESAKEILAAAGYKDIDGDGYVEKPNGSKLDLNFSIYTSREELKIYAQAAQASLKEVGIKLTIKVVENGNITEVHSTGNFDLLIWNVLVANTGDPEKYLYENWHSKSVTNKTGYNNSEVDKLLEELGKEFDPLRRRELAIEIQQLIMNDAVIAIFGYETTYLFSNKRVTGLKIYPMDYYWITSEVGLAE